MIKIKSVLFPLVTSRTNGIRLTAKRRAHIDSGDPGTVIWLSYNPVNEYSY